MESKRIFEEEKIAKTAETDGISTSVKGG